MPIMALGMVLAASVASQAQDTENAVINERMVPGVWIDPDGCEHWVMDDGWEGYMTPNVRPNGKPVCGPPDRQTTTCAILPADQFFASDSFALSAGARATLLDFFQNETAVAYIIDGHTDSRASDAYNGTLSMNRAKAVASVAQEVGATVQNIRAFGERAPRASNATAKGRSKNRRVEIQCVR